MATYKGNCKNCGCRFKFSEKSLNTEEDIFGNITTYVKCPVCEIRMQHGDWKVSEEDNSVKARVKFEKIQSTRIKKVGKFNDNGELVETYKSALEASRSTKIPLNTIYSACKNKKNRKTCGFFWKYL